MNSQDYKGTKRALIVEDSQVNRMLLSGFLQELGFRIMAAENGIQGLKQFEMHKPDIVFLDIVMPGVSGLEILKEMSTSTHKCVIIMVSSYVTQENIQKAKNYGADWFLVKPYTKEKLASIIKKFLDE